MASESRMQRNMCRHMFGKEFLTSLLLALGPVMRPCSSRDYRQNRAEIVLLSSSLDPSRKWDEVDRLRAAIELSKNVYGEDNEITLKSMNACGAQLLQAGRYGEAQAVLEDVCDLARKNFRREHAQTISGLTDLANTLIKAGGEFSPLRLSEAARLKKEVFEIRCDTIGKEHPETLKALKDYKDILRRIVDIEGELDECDCLRLGFEANTVDEIMRDCLDACNIGVSRGKVESTKDVVHSEKTKVKTEQRKLTILLKKPFKAVWNRFWNPFRYDRKKPKDANDKR
mmetsp:Transcript_107199/g.167435  ORF Transcript_107199/g.167435 Transcript_107199/m.167435 type:complete len:285 (+) Transcript_107199:50-904(+)